jgi:hypothetical protein
VNESVHALTRALKGLECRALLSMLLVLRNPESAKRASSQCCVNAAATNPASINPIAASTGAPISHSTNATSNRRVDHLESAPGFASHDGSKLPAERGFRHALDHAAGRVSLPIDVAFLLVTVTFAQV